MVRREYFEEYLLDNRDDNELFAMHNLMCDLEGTPEDKLSLDDDWDKEDCPVFNLDYDGMYECKECWDDDVKKIMNKWDKWLDDFGFSKDPDYKVSVDFESLVITRRKIKK